MTPPVAATYPSGGAVVDARPSRADSTRPAPARVARVLRQPGLFDARLASLGSCAFGPGDPFWLGPHHCPACADYVARVARRCA
jgi:hypothetical protein